MIFSGGSIAEGLSMYPIKVPLCKIWRFLHKVHDFPQINMPISAGLYASQGGTTISWRRSGWQTKEIKEIRKGQNPRKTLYNFGKEFYNLSARHLICPNRQKLGRDIVQLFSDHFPPFLSGFRERSLLASAALVFVFHWIRTLIGNKLPDSDKNILS